MGTCTHAYTHTIMPNKCKDFFKTSLDGFTRTLDHVMTVKAESGSRVMKFEKGKKGIERPQASEDRGN